MTNMEEMIILNREILTRTTTIQVLIWAGLWLVVFFGMWKIIRERVQETYKIVLVCLMVFGAYMTTADIVRNNRLGKQA